MTQETTVLVLFRVVCVSSQMDRAKKEDDNGEHRIYRS
jgi:hypothetical protein